MPKRIRTEKMIAVKDPHGFNVKPAHILMSEASIQRAVCQNLRYRGAEKMTWYAVPNGGSRNPIEAKKMVEQGLRAGVPDLMFIIKGECFGLELKMINGRLSGEQLRMHVEMMNAGVTVYTAYSLDDALEWLETIGALKAAAGSRFASA